MDPVRYILASSSPRRRELLTSIGLPFEVVPSHIPEVRAENETPQHYVERLAVEKGRAVAGLHPTRWIISADTTVFLDEQVLEKPEGVADAERMLRMISGRTHVVFTGLALRNEAERVAVSEVTTSEVTLVSMNDRDIAWYAGSGEPLDKAGAYAVQGLGAMFIESVNGSFTNVVGLPLSTLFRMLRRAGLDPLAGQRPG